MSKGASGSGAVGPENAVTTPDELGGSARATVHELFDGPWGYANWRAFLADFPEAHASEYALISDAHFTGHLVSERSPYQVLNMVAREDGTARAALSLRVGVHWDRDVVSEKLAEMGAAPAPVSDSSRFHGGDLRDELAALLALALGTRVHAGEHTRDFRAGGDPRGRPVAYEGRRARPLVRSGDRHIVPGVVGTRSLETDLLANYPTLKPATATALLRAARSYQEAVWVAEVDPSLAWLLLVSAVETAANQWYPVDGRGSELTPAQLLALSKPNVVQELERAEGTDLVQRVADEIAHLFKATDKFIRFLERFMPDSPSARPPEFVALGWSKRKMREALSQVYELRSRALHAGVPYPPPMCEAPFPLDVGANGVVPVAEIPYYTLSYQQGGFWVASDTPMILNTFEYITRNALQGWWGWLGERAREHRESEAAL
jgi:hypothetical protein